MDVNRCTSSESMACLEQPDMLFVTTSMDALTGAHYANKTLMAGFTTVRDLGGNPEAIYALRDAVAIGLVSGPRIIAAGSALADLIAVSGNPLQDISTLTAVNFVM